MYSMREIVKTFIVPILITLITVKISLRKFRTEKWWEKKAETYSLIIDALHKLKNYCEQKLAAEEYKAEYTSTSGHLSREEETELANQYQQAHKEVTRAIDVGSFIISEAALKALSVYKNRPQLDWDTNWLGDIIAQDLKYTTTCLENFKKEAKKDLGI